MTQEKLKDKARELWNQMPRNFHHHAVAEAELERIGVEMYIQGYLQAQKDELYSRIKDDYIKENFEDV